jgi:hypothetical protein
LLRSTKGCPPPPTPAPPPPTPPTRPASPAIAKPHARSPETPAGELESAAEDVDAGGRGGCWTCRRFLLHPCRRRRRLCPQSINPAPGGRGVEVAASQAAVSDAKSGGRARRRLPPPVAVRPAPLCAAIVFRAVAGWLAVATVRCPLLDIFVHLFSSLSTIGWGSTRPAWPRRGEAEPSRRGAEPCVGSGLSGAAPRDLVRPSLGCVSRRGDTSAGDLSRESDGSRGSSLGTERAAWLAGSQPRSRC